MLLGMSPIMAREFSSTSDALCRHFWQSNIETEEKKGRSRHLDKTRYLSSGTWESAEKVCASCECYSLVQL